MVNVYRLSVVLVHTGLGRLGTGLLLGGWAWAGMNPGEGGTEAAADTDTPGATGNATSAPGRPRGPGTCVQK